MTIQELFQAYAPLAGLAVLCFWIGTQSQRIKTLETTCTKLEAADTKDDSSVSDVRDRLVKLETLMGAQKDAQDSMGRTLDGIQRVLSSMATGSIGSSQIIELGANKR